MSKSIYAKIIKGFREISLMAVSVFIGLLIFEVYPKLKAFIDGLRTSATGLIYFGLIIGIILLMAFLNFCLILLEHWIEKRF